jgi:hypothetical protein
MKKKLSAVLRTVIGTYITHRDNQHKVAWDKEADCRNITAIAFADGFIRCEQCCGTWWFSVKRGKSIWVFECNENNYTKTLKGIKRDVSSNALTKLFGARA